MNDLRTAAQQAMEALESSRVFVTSREKIKHPEGTEWYDERIAALRAALAQQAEPVAGVVLNEEGRAALVEHGREEWHCVSRNARRLYTAPPQRKPLTEEEIERIGMKHVTLREVIRAVERAHGIKEQV